MKSSCEQILMEISKTFDDINHEVLIAKVATEATQDTLILEKRVFRKVQF